jgi:hypothetical protein
MEFAAPMKHFKAVLSTTPTNSNSTKVTITMNYTMKYGPLGYIMGATIVKSQMKRIVGKAQAGMDRHLATGATIGPDFVDSGAEWDLRG